MCARRTLGYSVIGARQPRASRCLRQAVPSGLQRMNGEDCQRRGAQIARNDAGFWSTERHRSRTCLASGYDAVLVLKTSWGTGPGRSDEELSRALRAENRSNLPLRESDDLVVLAHAPEESSGWTVPPMKAT
jgi:hypothetical protein